MIKARKEQTFDRRAFHDWLGFLFYADGCGHCGGTGAAGGGLYRGRGPSAPAGGRPGQAAGRRIQNPVPNRFKTVFSISITAQPITQLTARPNSHLRGLIKTLHRIYRIKSPKTHAITIAGLTSITKSLLFYPCPVLIILRENAEYYTREHIININVLII